MPVHDLTRATLFVAAADFDDPDGPRSLRGGGLVTTYEVLVLNLHGTPPVPRSCIEFLRGLVGDEHAPRVVLTEASTDARRQLAHAGLLHMSTVYEGLPNAPITVPMWRRGSSPSRCNAAATISDCRADSRVAPLRPAFAPMSFQEVRHDALPG
jgi:hypothetical protein